MNSVQYANAEVLIYDDLDTMTEEWAGRFCRAAAEALDARGRFTVALTGGKTPADFYARLNDAPWNNAVDWTRVFIFFGDERSVGPDDPQSNYGMAVDAWLGEGAVPSTQIFRMEGDAEDLAAAAARYESTVKEYVEAGAFGIPSFDLLLLGLGPDGHVASLFPQTAALDERHRLVMPNEVPQHKTRRLTFTWPLINSSRQVWMMATGEGKAEAAARAMGHLPGGDQLPVWHVRPAAGRVTWWLDGDAAAHIPPEEQDRPGPI